MTREEIIQGLQLTIDMFLFDPLTGEALEKPRNDMDKTTIDACKGAIELLEQQPCGDAISREEAIGAVANLFEMSEYPHPYPQGKPIRLKDIKEKLKQLPPVQPKPKTGHWIVHPKGIYAHLVCDKCLSNAPYDCRTNYCPNCGAKMIESQESEG